MKKTVLFLFITFVCTSFQTFAQTNNLLTDNIKNLNSTTKKELKENLTVKKKSSEIVNVKPQQIKTSLQDIKNSNTGINYLVEKKGFVTLKIFDDNKNEVACLINRIQSPGAYFANYSAINLERGIYTYRLSINNIEQEPKLLLVK